MTVWRRTGIGVATALCVALTAACGSTVQTSDALGPSIGGVSSTGENTPGGSLAGGESVQSLGQAPTTGDGTSNAARVGKVAAARPMSPATGERTSRAGVGVGYGPGVTATTINIGTVYNSATTRGADFGSQFGAKGLVYGDLRGMQRALADYINARGGLGGRSIKLVEHDIAADNNSMQPACVDWTEDHQVFAGIYAGGQMPSDQTAACMAAHHALYVTTPFIAGDEGFFQRYSPYYYTPRGLESARLGRDYIDGLDAAGFFTGRHKIGLVYYDVPTFHVALNDGMIPALRAHGLTIAESASVGYTVDDSGDAAAVSAIQNAELKFAANGVDRVLFLDSGAGLAFFFMQAAKSQHYYPHYGLNTGSDPALIATNFDASTLAGAMGVGWVPPADVVASAMPKSAARSLCLRIMKSAGQVAQSVDDLLVQYNMCSTFFFLQAALNAAAAPNATAVAQALNKLAEVPAASAASLGDGYRVGKPWGVQHYSDTAYQTACSCFRYLGQPRPV